MGNIILTVVDYKTNITVGFSGFYVTMDDFSEDSFICFIAIRILVSIDMIKRILVSLQDVIEKVVAISVVDRCLSQFGKVIIKQSLIRRDFIGALYECTNGRVFIALRVFTGIV